MVGAVRGIDPLTGASYDDTKRMIDAAGLTEEKRRKIFETNARKVYRLDRVAGLNAAGARK
jgi:4-oxalmesaconate hydratase